MIFGFFRRPHEDERTRAIYAAIVAQARRPAFYSGFAVPDTLEGRYEMLMLHAFLYLHRLKTEPEPVRKQGQEVFDLMFLDMDRSLREMGVGDLSVPKKIKKMAGAFYGRTAVYDAALAGDGEGLAPALGRNIFGDETRYTNALARYVHAAVDQLAGQSGAVLAAGVPAFPEPAAFVAAQG